MATDALECRDRDAAIVGVRPRGERVPAGKVGLADDARLSLRACGREAEPAHFAIIGKIAIDRPVREAGKVFSIFGLLFARGVIIYIDNDRKVVPAPLGRRREKGSARARSQPKMGPRWRLKERASGASARKPAEER